jgi:hypothetical protein
MRSRCGKVKLQRERILKWRETEFLTVPPCGTVKNSVSPLFSFVHFVTFCKNVFQFFFCFQLLVNPCQHPVLAFVAQFMFPHPHHPPAMLPRDATPNSKR